MDNDDIVDGRDLVGQVNDLERVIESLQEKYLELCEAIEAVSQRTTTLMKHYNKEMDKRERHDSVN
jgi:prefoldin subunit 5